MPLQDLPEDAPVLILLPGLTGGSGCSYVLHAVRRAARHGIRAVVFNSRGTADSPVLTPQVWMEVWGAGGLGLEVRVKARHWNNALQQPGQTD